MNLLMIASEAAPFCKSGGLADVMGALPKELCAGGHDCRVVLPLYQTIRERYGDKLVFMTSLNVPLSWRNQYCGLFTCQLDGVTYYFIDNEYYFKRGDLYGYFDDGERFAFFSKAVLEAVQYLDFYPELLHCHDWQTGLVPVFLDCFYRDVPKLNAVKTVFTIHNIQYQGKFSLEIATDLLGLPLEKIPIVEYDLCVNYMKGGLAQADAVTTVSPEYAKEILDPWFAFGLDPFLRQHQDKLVGILNGLDTKEYNPKTDPSLVRNYDRSNPHEKAVNKQQLQSSMGLEKTPNVMMVGMVTRLVEQKGMDLVEEALDEIMKNPIQLMLLGSGDSNYVAFFERAQQMYPGRIAVYIGFDEALSRNVYAASDVFLMPSKTEPCGLSQLIALRYGAVPVVRLTGGLKDTIHDFGEGGKTANGFTFYAYDSAEMMSALLRAFDAWDNEAKWEEKVKQAMSCDFSWERSSKEYLALYKKLLA